MTKNNFKERQGWSMKYFLVFFSALIFFLQGCGSYNDKKPSITTDIHDNPNWYPAVTGNDILETFIKIPLPNDFLCKPYNDLNAAARPCTLADIENDKNPYDDYEPILHVNFQTQDYTIAYPNASMKQKGKSTREAKQASFRIKLDNNVPLYRRQRTFNLNKHFYDYSRVRNMFAFELFQSIPNFTSLRTQFIHLTIDDGNKTEDYGLFTHVEQCDSLYLVNHGFSKRDNLYKAQEYAFSMTDALALDSKGKPINKAAFDAVLEMKNGKDRKKVIEMTQAVENAQTNEAFEEVFNKYFNRNNYLTWFALNILLDNKDTITQNFFLLNPALSDTFYFLPWDYDGIAFNRANAPKWSKGIANWWMSPLHRKFLMIKKNRDDLDKMIYHLRNTYVTDEKIHAMLDKYKPLVEPYVTRLPDSRYLYGQWETDFNFIRNDLVPGSIKEYEETKGHPMPFWQYTEKINGKFYIGWDESIDLENDPLIYSLQIASDPDFNNTIINENNVDKNTSNIVIDPFTGSFLYQITDSSGLVKGHNYYMKVISREKNDSSHYQIAFNNEIANHPGVLEFKFE